MNSENITEPKVWRLNIPKHVWQDYVHIGFLLILVAVGVPVNVLSIVRTFLTLKSCKRAKSCHMILFKLHLAIADLLILFMYATSRAIWLVTLKWVAGNVFCKLFKFCHTFALCCASYLVTVVALYRLHAMSNLQKNRDVKTEKYFQTMINVSYVMAAIFSLPQFYVWETINPFVQDPDWAQCVTIWAKERINSLLHNVTVSHQTFYRFEITEQIYSIGNMLFTFYIPFIIIAISYCMVWLKFRQSIKITQDDLLLEHHRRKSSAASSIKRHSSSSFSDHNEPPVHRMMELLVVLKVPKILQENESPQCSFSLNRLVRAKHVAAKKAAYIIVAYLVFWCPYNILGVVSFIYPTLIHATSLYRLLYDCIVINAVINPFIYGI